MRELFANVEMLAVAAAAILLFFSFVARITVVDGGSMNDTLHHGDKLIVSDLFYTPKRGDVVIVQSPDVLDGKVIVKRVIAVEGDRIRVESDGVYVNDEKLEEPYLSETNKLHITTMPERTVDKGMVFLLGDNRNRSEDSRAFGQVDERAVVGKVLFRFAPFSAIGFVN